ncbi:MAG: aminopeptidase P family protein [Nitrospirae bacterium]|nr:aminopeptidase P family protein [Nitrospirota bacterium]
MTLAAQEASLPTGTARLIIAASEQDSNLYYATRFLAPDAFIYLRDSRASLLLMSDLELDRAKTQATVDEVLSYSVYEAKARADTGGACLQAGTAPTLIQTLSTLLRERQITRLLVPSDFPLSYADGLRQAGFQAEAQPNPYFPARLIKRQEEIDAITAAQRATETAVDEAVRLIASSRVKDDLLYAPGNGQGAPLTSERIKQIINLKLMEMGYVAQHTIIACGRQACDPHNEGSGPLRANQPIIMDVFPRSSSTRYFADMSRTIVKGRASDGQKRLYDLVREAQEMAIGRIKSGAEGQAIHEAIMALFDKAGCRTGLINGRMQGFFHGTGHGVGLDIHEAPRISRSGSRLETGHVVTVEPGLYYPEIGAVRLEDMVVVTETGCINLTQYPKVLEV